MSGDKPGVGGNQAGCVNRLDSRHDPETSASLKSSFADLGKIKSKVRYLAGLIPDLASKALVVSAFYVSKARYCLALAATTSSMKL
jgi:hypothetical protein